MDESAGVAQDGASMAGNVLSYAFSTAFVLGAVVGYIPQWFVIRKDRNADGFSTHVSLVLLVANITRVFFWFVKAFELTLLMQSLAVIAAQLCMIQLCVSVRGSAPLGGGSVRRRRASDLQIADFWKWDDFPSYLYALAALTGALAILTLLFGSFPWYVETLGVVALGIEACLGIPQALKNHRKKSTEGVSGFMLASWFVGDAFKTLYFIYSGAPIQFLLCGIFQLSVDMVLLHQLEGIVSLLRCKWFFRFVESWKMITAGPPYVW